MGESDRAYKYSSTRAILISVGWDALGEIGGIIPTDLNQGRSGNACAVLHSTFVLGSKCEIMAIISNKKSLRQNQQLR